MSETFIIVNFEKLLDQSVKVWKNIGLHHQEASAKKKQFYYLEISGEYSKDGFSIHLYPEEQLLSQPSPGDIGSVLSCDP